MECIIICDFSGGSFFHLLFKEFTTELNAKKSTQRKPRHPKLGAEGIVTIGVSICALCLLLRARKRKIAKRQATASGPSRPEASSTKATKHLA